MTVEELDVFDELFENIPSYIQEYKNYYKLITRLLNYIEISFNKVIKENILDKIFKIDDSNNILLQKLANLFNIDLDIISDENELRTILRGFIINRGTNANFLNNTNKDGVFESLEVTIRNALFPRVIRVDIIDNAIRKNLMGLGDPMTLDIRLLGAIGEDYYSLEILQKYILPNITGVKWNVSYLVYGNELFSWDIWQGIDNPISEERGYGKVGWDKGTWDIPDEI